MTIHEKGLYRIIGFGTAVSFGILGGLIVSMEDFFAGKARLHFSYRTVIGFVSGAVIGWLLWRGIRSWSERNRGGL